MSVKIPLPAEGQIKTEYPLSEALRIKKQRLDCELKRNLETRQRLTVVAGPCSADNEDAVLQYCGRLAELQKQYSPLFIVARVYTCKPHSNGEGYQGLCITPHGAADVAQGLRCSRRLMLNVLKEGLPVADELLYPQLYRYFDDVISYAFLGARSSEDSFHRGVASGLDILCGVKNSTGGRVESAVQSLYAVCKPNVFPFDGCQVQTDGCKYAHVVLRGGMDRQGYFSNMDGASTAKTKQLLENQGLCDFIMTDLSHANSGKVAKNQLENAKIAAADKNVNGVMAESYLLGGSGDGFGVSKTDECLSLDDTRRMLDILAEGFLARSSV